MSNPTDARAYSPAWRDPPTFVATVGGIGLLPGAPGSWASLAALPAAWLILDHFGPWALGAAALAVFALGWWAAASVIRRTGDDDPGPIVIDEVAGQFAALIPAAAEPWLFVIGFILFRIADIAKPWPVSWVDRRVKGGFGTMADDVLAGIYALAGVWLAREAMV